VLPSRDEIFRALSSDAFDPRGAVLLESEPPIEPVKGNSIGTAEVMRKTTDDLEVVIDIATPAILLVTNNYSAGWRARSLDRVPVQAEYAIQPADYSFQAIALREGRHRFVIEYNPTSFRVGKWVSVATVLPLCAAALVVGRRERKRLRRNAHAPMQGVH
jgi:hypothetical protein